MRPGQKGYTIVEVVYALAIFGIFLLMLTTMMTEMRRQERRFPIDFMQHPQITAVMSRLRRDVVDAFGANPYPASFNEYRQGPDTLIIYTIMGTGFGQTIVWDFRKNGEARRTAYSAGNVVSDWVARGVPKFEISTFDMPSGGYSLRVSARNSKGTLAIDQIFKPRSR